MQFKFKLGFSITFLKGILIRIKNAVAHSIFTAQIIEWLSKDFHSTVSIHASSFKLI